MTPIQLEDLLSAPAGTAKTQQIVAAKRLKVLLLRLAKGEVLSDHRAPGSITIHCVAGKLSLHSGDESLALKTGTIVCLEEGVVHRLEALEDSAILLTIGFPVK